jgi:hypothetical protein
VSCLKSSQHIGRGEIGDSPHASRSEVCERLGVMGRSAGTVPDFARRKQLRELLSQDTSRVPKNTQDRLLARAAQKRDSVYGRPQRAAPQESL